MANVHILAPDIISKIAAGEVIDRPASVIKELVENAFDAGTPSLSLQLKQAGKISIHIKDTGSGIASDDMEKIFVRHSTSKIKTADDLFNIHSLGFRGEALYSIAAVADVILRSKTPEQAEGWEIHVRGGKTIALKPVSLPGGTELEIKELFFNTPARRKFLKSNVSEMNHILNTVIPYALLYPHVRFHLESDDKVILDLRPQEKTAARIAEVLNLNSENILEVKQQFPDKDLSVRMVLGDINIIRSRRDMQFIFINNRPVESKNISYHMNDIYRLILPPRNYPFFALFIDLPPENIDVNIHPTKREVKIKDEQGLCSLLRRMCENALMAAGRPKEVADRKAETPVDATIARALLRNHGQELPPLPEATGLSENDEEDTGPAVPTEQYSFPEESHTFPFAGEDLLSQAHENLQNKFIKARYIGPFIDKFLLFEAGRSLLIVDQHAAQERITFEHFISQMQESRVEVQHLLSPYLLKLTRQEVIAWEEAKGMLETIGFSTTQFDDETIAIHTHPLLIKQPDRAVRDILAGETAVRIDHETIARRACRASIMAGDRLSPEQADYQRQQLIKCRDPFTCPHGRPTIIEMKEDFLDKQFLRT